MARRTEQLLTVDALYALPDDGEHYELVAGRLVREPLPGPRHGRVCSNANYVLQSWARETGAGIVYSNDTGFVLKRNPDTVRGPDIAFVCAVQPASEEREPYFEGAPDLAVEVLSPGNRRNPMRDKVRDYLAAGARMVWVLDPRARTLAVHTARETEVLGINDTFTAPDRFPGLSFVVRALFE